MRGAFRAIPQTPAIPDTRAACGRIRCCCLWQQRKSRAVAVCRSDASREARDGSVAVTFAIRPLWAAALRDSDGCGRFSFTGFATSVAPTKALSAVMAIDALGRSVARATLRNLAFARRFVGRYRQQRCQLLIALEQKRHALSVGFETAFAVGGVHRTVQCLMRFH